MSPPLAFGWHIWTRHRLGLSLCAGYWLLLGIVSHTLPIKSWPRELVAPLFLIPCGGAFGYLILVLSVGRDARLEGRESGYPSRLWTLPLRTRSLVGWPMLWGTSVLALAWLTLPWGVLQSPDVDMTLLIWLPALMLSVTLAWLQALVWSPSPLPGLRLFALGPIIGAGLIGPEILLVESGFHSSIGYGLLVVQLPLAYLTAVYGVSRARRGDVPHWNWPGWPAWLRWTSARTIGQPFTSPAQAQLWFEWRRWGLGHPVVLAGFALLTLPTLPYVARFFEEGSRADLPVAPVVLSQEIGHQWLALAELLFLPALLASSAGNAIGPLPGRLGLRSLSAFLATRPVSAYLMIRAKFVAAALSTLAGWAVFSFAILVWFVLGGHAAEMLASFAELRQRHPPLFLWSSLGLFVGTLILLTWLQMVQGIWMGLVRSRWRQTATWFGLAGLAAVAVLGAWTANSPRLRQILAEALPWLAGGVVVLKGLLAGWSVGALKQRNLLPPVVLWGALAVWSVVAVGLFAMLSWLLPGGRIFVSSIVLGIALLLPLTRLALAPLALDWIRHQ